MMCAHLQHATPEAVDEHAKQGSSYELSPILKKYVYIATLAGTAPDRGQLEGALRKTMNDMQWHGFLELKLSAILRAPLCTLAYGALWSLKFRCSMFPLHRPLLRRIPANYVGKDTLLRSCYSVFYMISDVQITDPETTLPLEGQQKLVPIKIPIPQSVNADLINRYRFLSSLWHFQSCPVMAADEGLMQMSQSVVDYCLAVVMPKRPLTSKTSRRRRASLSALHDMRLEAKPRFPLKPPCHCERRLFV
ncbi:uncharacterized protein B0H18DRAFT_671060 [Fomitopsis serialis]|uniref:uncharacterized protein n=1 Tax=Fomitopsis serialis TaxID=139415 RepID=UPI00200872B1|nr:uncharacterized protein B0H18DRAFT_671060 [Neoantrodia serialis]KAH9932901.1 hypothetical protein B0H18DRAFT_671060 [Neoantrodia serialis]